MVWNLMFLFQWQQIGHDVAAHFDLRLSWRYSNVFFLLLATVQLWRHKHTLIDWTYLLIVSYYLSTTRIPSYPFSNPFSNPFSISCQGQLRSELQKLLRQPHGGSNWKRPPRNGNLPQLHTCQTTPSTHLSSPANHHHQENKDAVANRIELFFFWMRLWVSSLAASGNHSLRRKIPHLYS